MTDKEQWTRSLITLFQTEMEMDIPATETDLLESGYLDSLSFAQLLSVLEEKTGLKFEVEDLEIERFTTIEKISEFIVEKLSGEQTHG